MASGTSKGSIRGSLSEPRKKLPFQLVDDDYFGTGSRSLESRPNNWEFSDWRPLSTLDTGKRIKKGNPEKEKEKEEERVRERRRDNSVSSSQGEGRRLVAPSTYPRTKPSSSSLAQHMALENLRQQLSFSDADEIVSNDEDRNNERQRPSLRNDGAAANYFASRGGYSLGAAADSDSSKDFNFNVRPDEPDSTQIVGRLMQIRDYIKQASAMMDGFKKSDDAGSDGTVKQLQDVILRLRDQEEKYLDMLMKLSESNNQHIKLENLTKHLEDQERDYLKMLQRLLAAKEESLIPQNHVDAADTDTEVGSVDLDVRSLQSDTTNDTNDDARHERPNIEDRLGLHSDADELPSARSSRTNSSEKDNLTGKAEQATCVDPHELQLKAHRRRLEADLAKKNEDLEALKQQHELLKKMLYQQEQLRALQGRQAALRALQRDAEQKLIEEKDRNPEEPISRGTAGATAAANKAQPDQSGLGSVTSDSEDCLPTFREVSQSMPSPQSQLKHQLDYLKNVYNLPDKSDTTEDDARPQSVVTESDISVLSVERRQLQNKLQDLQDKKHQMDDLLQELQSIRRSKLLLNNDTESNASSQGFIWESVAAANHTAGEAQDVLEALEARKKLKKLQEVRQRLNQLRDLVQYYQNGNNFIHGQDDLPEGADNLLPTEEQLAWQISQLRQDTRDSVAEKFKMYGEGTLSQASESQQASESGSTQGMDERSRNMVSTSTSPWGDDPGLREKVKKLHSAKEKLCQLQELVAMVQQTPEMVQALPDDLADLAMSIDETTSLASQATSQNIDLRELQERAYQQRAEAYESKMHEQKAELDNLMEERQKLLLIQEQLQKLYEQLPGHGPSASSDQDTSHMNEQGDASSITQVKSVPESMQVTFQEPLETVASYDELYGRMRQQRMLREELRDKKKELESMMRKDRPKKNYFRNQDNQSDNVSFSNKSDPFGTQSGDITLATWGGSTADNLESIEEDENDSGAGQGPAEDEEVDDGYPSDGIVQVEEEEEAESADETGTYTIEDDYRGQGQRKVKRRNPGPNSTRRLTSQSRSAVDAGRRGHPGAYWSVPEPPPRSRSKKAHNRAQAVCPAEGLNESDDSSMHSELQNLKSQLEDTRAQVVALQSGAGVFNSNSPGLIPFGMVGQLQQQQNMLNLNQSYQYMMQQQIDTVDRLRRIELLLTGADYYDSRPPGSLYSSPQNPYANRLNNNNSTGLARAPLGQTFTFEPQPFRQEGAGYMMESPSSQQNTRLNRDQMVHNQLNANKSGARPKEYPQNSNPPLRTGPRNQVSEGEDIPIETIQASDQGVPRLNLAQMLRNRSSKNKRQESESVISDMSSNSKAEGVVGRVYPTNGKANAASRLASLQAQMVPRPGLSAGISGTAYIDNASVSSYVSSVPGDGSQVEAARPKQPQQRVQQPNGVDGGNVDLNLFEALRDTIYSEVATLISQNENRPHFLIELFRELQLLNNDYMRQRALYAVQQLVTQQLTESDADAGPSGSQQRRVKDVKKFMYNGFAEATPSESQITSDEEEIKYVLAQLHAQQEGRRMKYSGSAKTGQAAAQGTPGSKKPNFDYAENVETASSMSTPNSSTYWDNPFAKESLGDTVIHLDKAMQRMREYERKLTSDNNGKDGASPEMRTSPRKDIRTEVAAAAPKDAESVASSSAQDNCSESSMSDFPDTNSVSEAEDNSDKSEFTRIDTQQLDSQITGIMSEIIPVLHEHMDDVCSQQLLQYIRSLVLTLTKQKDNSHEFVRFFHKQLGSILQDSLTKFEGRKLRECAEDVLVELSEILFNELAFFHIMQDLNPSKAMIRASVRKWREGQESQTSTEGATKDGSESTQNDVNETSASSEEDEDDEDQDKDGLDDKERTETEIETETEAETDEDENEEDDEDLGKARDDELAAHVDIKDDEGEARKSPVKIELAPSETKPYTRIGSDEDDESEDETRESEDPSDTAVSRSAIHDHLVPSGAADGSGEGEEEADEVVKEEEKGQEEEKEKDEGDEEENDDEEEEGPAAENTTTNGPVNGEVAEEGEITVDDLPSNGFKAPTGESMDRIEKKLFEEQEQTSGAQGVLNSITVSEELAGDGNAVKDPDDV